MKALILAGGFGTRLRPLSCTRPKILFPIGNKPLIEWTLQKLSKFGVSEVIFAVNYRAEDIQKFCGNEKYGIKISYSYETSPMGTGGPIKLAEKILNLGEDEELLILNGDIFSDVDFGKLGDFHKNHSTMHGTVLTITLFEVEDPSRYGVVELDEIGKILRFVEKPKEKPVSRLINAGIYATNKKIFGYLKDGKHSIEKEVFPILAEKGLLYGFKHEGLWVDIGKIEDFMLANFKILEQVSKDKPQLAENVEINSKAKIIPPVIIGSNVKIDEKAKIGPYVVVGDDVLIGENCKIKNSILFGKSTINAGCKIKNSVLGEKVFLGKNVKVGKGCIIGDCVVLADNIKIAKKVTVCPYKEVEDSILKPKNVF